MHNPYFIRDSPEMIDPFAEVVALLQPSLPFSKMASGAGAWRVDGAERQRPLFCVILEGAARLTMTGEPPVDLQQGDFILIPAVENFVMSDADAAADPDIDPFTVTMTKEETRHGDPDGPVNARMLVGGIDFGSPDAALLVSLLPRLIHVRGEARFSTIVQLIRNEARDERPGREMILSRLLEVLLIEALRSASGDGAPSGLLRGLADARLAVALRRMHEAPRTAWTVEQLASEAALSRSVFFDRFRKTVGVSPMEYLLSWRMALAKNLLRGGDASVKDVAERVGYGSASAFSVAFSRFVGTPPARYAQLDGHSGDHAAP